MSFTVTGDNRPRFPLHPVGPAIFRCTKVIDLGHQESTFKGEKKVLPKVFIEFESSIVVTGHNHDEYNGQPMRVNTTLTRSLHEKASLRKLLEQWRGRPFTEAEANRFDLSQVLNKAAFINVIHAQVGDKTYVNIGSIMPLPAGMVADPAKTTPVSLSLNAGEFKRETFDALPKWLQERIAKSPEYRELSGGAAPASGSSLLPDDDIPF